MKSLLKYCLVFLAGIASTKLMAYIGYQLYLSAAEKCVADYPQIMPFLLQMCMHVEHPIMMNIAKILTLNFWGYKMARQQFRKGIVQDTKKDGKVHVIVVKIGGKKIAIKNSTNT